MNYPNSQPAKDSTFLPIFPRYQGHNRFDVCVIGGGYTGLSASLHLAELGYRVALIEAKRIGWGASGRNGGQLGYGMARLQPDLVRQFNEEVARRFWDFSVESVDLFHELCERHAIDCDFSSGVLACATSQANLEHLNQHVDLVESYGHALYERLDKSATRYRSGSDFYAGSILSHKSGHLNPLKYALGLAKAAQNAGVSIYEMSTATAIEPTQPARIMLETESISADYVVIGCNGYLGNLSKRLAHRILPVDNYQAATEVLSDQTLQTLIKGSHCVWDTTHSVHYFRLTPDNRLIMGCGIGIPGNPPKYLQKDCRIHIATVYPQLRDVKIDTIWEGTLAGTSNLLPDVGKLAPNVYYAQGYTGHGVGTAPLTGKCIADEIHGWSEGFELLSSVNHKSVPGGRFLRTPAILSYRLLTNTRDRLTFRRHQTD